MFPMRDLSNLLTQIEGQYFERKSLWEGPPERRKTRDRRAVRDPLSQLVFRNLLHHFELTKATCPTRTGLSWPRASRQRAIPARPP